MESEQTDNNNRPLALPSGAEEQPTASEDDDLSTREAALSLALYSASVAWDSINTAVRLTGRLGGFILSPVKRDSDRSPVETALGGFEKLVDRGETALDEWIQTGRSQDLRTRKAAKNAVDSVINGVVGYVSTHPAVEKLVRDQIELLARESPEMPQINILVRVLADNYITYLNENPDQVKQLIQNQADVYIDHLSENPEQVQELVQGQTTSMIGEITDEVRERMVTADSALESLVRALFRRPPRSELPEPPPEVQARALQARLPQDFPRLEAMSDDES
jgi:hypothetical protein